MSYKVVKNKKGWAIKKPKGTVNGWTFPTEQKAINYLQVLKAMGYTK